MHECRGIHHMSVPYSGMENKRAVGNHTLNYVRIYVALQNVKGSLSPLFSFGGTVRKLRKVFPRTPLPEIPLVSLLGYGRLGFQGPIDVVAKSEELIRRWKLQEWDKNSLEFETWRSI